MSKNRVEVLTNGIQAIDDLVASEPGRWDHLATARDALLEEATRLVRLRDEALAKAQARSEGMRGEACERLRAIAAEFAVTASTLSQHAVRSGPYATRRRPRSDARLPDAYGDEGISLSVRVYEACAPWNPHYIGSLCQRQDKERASTA